VVVTTLTDQHHFATIEIKGPANGEVQRIACCFGGVKGKRLELETQERIPACTAVAVEYNDALFLGEVVACTEDCAGRWHVQVNVEQVLTGLQSLVNLRSRLMGESLSPVPIVPAVAAR
jgi:hypothetical protein